MGFANGLDNRRQVLGHLDMVAKDLVGPYAIEQDDLVIVTIADVDEGLVSRGVSISRPADADADAEPSGQQPIRSPTDAEMIGAGRSWMAWMISVLSILRR